ncbi:MAG: hypothetical protein A2V69_02160 [Candidatus Portnoybacteria bacterium RBG_13_40_8]|uniref:DUF4342 domain-containing protein n=1 Tax=Candidatus Portnoybacteria bacterium RBG_13_40_8 TaxID=1801990 RepID=A0A1G2F4G7_9BACT|nr:MAG: hypothetical protein A2V69_02160 [Candidatus Portnoybacteria bacterium RBG_13_40_8]
MENNNEEFKVSGDEVVKKVKELIKAGNARKIIIKNEKGESVIEIPLTFGAVGAILLPTLAAIGAVAALLTKCTIVVEKREGEK